MLNFFKKKEVKECKKSFVFTTRNIAESTGNGERIRPTGSTVISDFIGIESLTQYVSTTSSTNQSVKSTGNVDERKIVQPKDVFEEIKKETPEISFENLDEKIKVVRERVEILKEHLKEEHLGDEHRTLFYLENRKKYLGTKDKNPLDWAMTTQEAIADLCKTYKLRVVPLKQYYTLVPHEGIREMKRYTEAYKAITGDVPIFELVIKDAPAETKKKDRDPILLANSPLGNFLFVLGAWDDEVAIVDEIIYGLK